MKRFLALILASLTLLSAIPAPAEEDIEQAPALEDGVYLADFTTDSSMFHLNEVCEGKGVLTVEDGEMTIHIILGSKNFVNLFLGLAEDAKAEDAVLLEPTA